MNDDCGRQNFKVLESKALRLHIRESFELFAEPFAFYFMIEDFLGLQACD